MDGLEDMMDQVGIDQVGIDQVGIGQVGIDQVGIDQSVLTKIDLIYLNRSCGSFDNSCQCLSRASKKSV